MFLGRDVRHQFSAVPVMQRVAFAPALTGPGGDDDGVGMDVQLLGELGVMGLPSLRAEFTQASLFLLSCS
jgi:hypothetical protein